MTQSPAMVLKTDAFGHLVLEVDGVTHVGVTPVRAFPLSDPDRAISFCDAKGHEVWQLPDLAQLAPEMRRLLETEIARREFIPEVKRVLDISAGSEPTTWHVDTDRGERRFQLPSEDHVRRLGSDGALVTDEHGVRHRIRSIAALDGHSRRLLRRYL